jgi:hypothetical protein
VANHLRLQCCFLSKLKVFCSGAKESTLFVARGRPVDDGLDREGRAGTGKVATELRADELDQMVPAPGRRRYQRGAGSDVLRR